METKIKNILLLVVICLVFPIATHAQEGERKGRFDFEKMAKEKAVFLTAEMNLTDDEAKAFLPLESEFMKKKIQINRDARSATRELKKKENKTDEDYKKITEVNLDAEAKEAEVTKEYYQKFSNVLSAEKIERYRKADQKYMQMLLERRKQNRGK